MARYIDADKIPYYLDTSENAPMEGRRVAFKSDIDKIPTADVVEVKHGEWMKEGCGLRVCSECDFEYDHAGMPNEGLKYCPECGAKMDGGKAE